MADTEVTTNFGREDEATGAPFRVVVTAPGTAYVFYIGANDSEPAYIKKTSGSWGTEQNPFSVGTGEFFRTLSVWYDKWTPGNTGTVIHIVATDPADDEVHYWALDTADDTLDHDNVIVHTGTAFEGNASVADNHHSEVMVAKSGRIYVAGYGSATSGDEFFYSSDNGGTSFTARDDTFIEAVNADRFLLMPADLTDGDDIYALYYDESAGEFSIKEYDATADSWSESSVATGLDTDIYNRAWNISALPRHSDKHIIALVQDGNDGSAGGDDSVTIRCYDITNRTTVTTKTSVTGGNDDHGIPAICIDQQSDDLYAFYVGAEGGSEIMYTGAANVLVYYKKSTNGGTTWGSETAYSETGDDIRALWGMSIDDAGGHLAPVFMDYDDITIYENQANDIEIAAASGATATGTPTLPSLTANGSATHEQTSTGTPSLPSLTASGTAVMQPSATGTPSLPSLTANASATHEQTSTGTPSLPSLTASAAAVHKQTATGTPSLPSLTANAVAVMQPSATGTPSLPSLTASGSATQTQTSTGTPTLPALTANGNAVMQPSATGTPSLPSLTASAAGSSGYSGSGSPTLPSLTANGVAVMQPSATGTPSLPSLTANASATQTQTSTGTPSLPALTASGVAVMQPSATGTPSLPSLTANGSATQAQTSTGTPTLPSLTASGSATHTAGGSFTASGSPSLPALTASGSATHPYTATGTPTLPALTASASATQIQSATGTPSLPMLTASASATQAQTSTGTPTLPSLTASAVGVQTQSATGTPSLPSLTASGAAEIPALGTGTPTLPSLTASGNALLPAGVSLDVYGRESTNVDVFGRESLAMDMFGRESLDIDTFGRDTT